MMNSILHGISHVVCYIDDVLIPGTSEAEHQRNLEVVLLWLQENGLRLKCNKYYLFQSSVELLGHVIDAEGVHTSKKKVKAITDALAPINVTEL